MKTNTKLFNVKLDGSFLITILRPLVILLVIHTDIVLVISQTNNPLSYDCGMVEEPIIEEQDDDVCTLSSNDKLCVRIKFHYINNTSDESLAPTDSYYYNLLERINEVYAQGYIRFTLANNCIHRIENLNTTQLGELDQLHDQYKILHINHTDDPLYEEFSEVFDEDPNAIDVYTLQKPYPVSSTEPTKFRFYAEYYERAIVPFDSFKVIIHELGHTLGLRHTFSGDGFTQNAALDMVALQLCKANSTYCHYAGDGVCDTGLDPWTLSIGPDNDGIKDFDKWVNTKTCEQKTELSSSYVDGCNDSTNPWEIPVNNYMSYYRTCRKMFTTGQFCKAHALTTSNGSDNIISCTSDPYMYSVTDIEISSATSWMNTTVELYPGQKIIITGSGKLTLDHCILTRKPGPNNYCEELFGLWDGIYLKDLTSSGIALDIKNGTIIEYSRNGIETQGLKGSVFIDGSTFQNNLRIFNNGSGSENNHYIGSLSIFDDSEINVGSSDLSYDPLPEAQINLIGASLQLWNSKIVNPNDPYDDNHLTAIRSSRGRVNVANGSSIENFYVAIDKAADTYLLYSWWPNGLFISNSSIKNSKISILNTSQNVYVGHNWIEGNIVSEGLGYSRWLSNNINAESIVMQSPITSANFQDNLFHNLTLQFYGSNENSYSLCNTWQNPPSHLAFNAIAPVMLTESWGLESLSSGNSHLDQSNPSLLGDDNLVNFYYSNNTSELFSYNSSVVGGNATTDRVCSHDYPTEPPPFSNNYPSTSFNISNENTRWNSLNTTLGQKENALLNASTSQIPPLKREINYIKFQMHDIVGNVLSNITEADSLVQATWFSRANSGLIEYSNLMNKWYSKDFNGIQNDIGSLSSDDAQTLLECTQYVQSRLSSSGDLFSLDPLELDTLSKISSMSFGDYSNIVRDFLRVIYNIDIPWPTESNNIIPRTSGLTALKSNSNLNIYSISENPSNGCFIVLSSLKSKYDKTFHLKVIDLNGRQLESLDSSIGSIVCLNGLERGIYIVMISDPSSNVECHKIVIN